jgi:2-C-methyl-D-erythritol 4-phosphate cytidylyltransferase
MALWVVIPAAGVGARMQADKPKQYLELFGSTVLGHTLNRFLSDERFSGIVVAISPEDPYWGKLPVAENSHIHRVDGGSERCNSVLNALAWLDHGHASDDDWILVHDAARPCLHMSDLDALIESVTSHNYGGILATPVRDTMKLALVDEAQIEETIDRSRLWHALTPQMFRLGELKQALEQALADGFVVTDEASAMEHAGVQPLLIRGRADNIKITVPEDLELAEFYLGRRR